MLRQEILELSNEELSQIGYMFRVDAWRRHAVRRGDLETPHPGQHK
jgi:hypothetical protein